MTDDDALSRLVAWLRPRAVKRASEKDSSKPLHFALKGFIDEVAQQHWKLMHPQETSFQIDANTNSEPLHNAAWELVRRGALVPAMWRESAGDYRFTGEQFRVTSRGAVWLVMASDAPLPSEGGRFRDYLASHSTRMRPSFLLRASEAVLCYQTGAYLASCAMTGAAAESVLLSLAIAKDGDEVRVLAQYQQSRGLRKIRDLLTQQRDSDIHGHVDNLAELLKYWRDEAAHAGDARIDEEAAFMALVLLLRLVRFADQRWEAIVSPVRR
jgi:hypothetical protein